MGMTQKENIHRWGCLTEESESSPERWKRAWGKGDQKENHFGKLAPDGSRQIMCNVSRTGGVRRAGSCYHARLQGLREIDKNPANKGYRPGIGEPNRADIRGLRREKNTKLGSHGKSERANTFDQKKSGRKRGLRGPFQGECDKLGDVTQHDRPETQRKGEKLDLGRRIRKGQRVINRQKKCK